MAKQPAKPKDSYWRLFVGFLKKAKLNWLVIILVALVSLGQTYIALIVPDSTGDLFAGQFTARALWGAIGYYALSIVLAAGIAFVLLYFKAGQVKKLRVAGWEKLMKAGSAFHAKHNPQSLLTAITSDASAIVELVVGLCTSAFSNVVYIIGALGVIGTYHPRLLLITLVVIPFYVLYAAYFGKWTLHTTYKVRMQIGNLTGYLADRIRNLPLIKSSAMEEQEAEKGTGTIQQLYKANMNNHYLYGINLTFSGLVTVIITAGSVVCGSFLLKNSEITLDDWIAFYLYMPTITTRLENLFNMWTSFKSLQGSVIRYSEILDAPSEEDSTGMDEIPDGDISFRDVRFGYESKPVLDGVNFTIPRGKVSALVGVSGSGKTTALNLLERFYEPESGQILVSETPIAELNLYKWRKTLAYVQQTSGVFGGTIRQAMTYGLDREVTDAELLEVAAKAGLMEVLEKIGGLDTDLAACGASLSGGQRQRLVIARELLRNADVLLLDEPTSALDMETAREIADMIYDNFGGKTVLIITHELNFISGAEHIVMLSGGKTVAQGTHAELMESCTLYRELVEEQSYQEAYAL